MKNTILATTVLNTIKALTGSESDEYKKEQIKLEHVFKTISGDCKNKWATDDRINSQ
jgi:hypothetical protein